MGDNFIADTARDNFNKARVKETLSQILFTLTPERQHLLSLQDVKDLLRPKREYYKGLKVVPIKMIVGSEGRYMDFNQSFLPKHEHVRHRWESIDRAHQKDINLPPVKVYKIGEVYFVRDGNHRVSVAKMQGVENIDAEVIELDAEIAIEPGMTQSDLRKKVISYEQTRTYRKTELGKVIQKEDLIFTETGRYLEILKHINVHKYFLNEDQEEEISFRKAGKSWLESMYLPIIRTIEKNNLLFRFPGRTKSDLYVWIIQHWYYLKEVDGNIPIEDAVVDYAKKYGKGFFQQFRDFLRKVFRRNG